MTEHKNGNVCLALEDATSVAIVELETDELQRLAGEVVTLAAVPSSFDSTVAIAQFNEALRLIAVAGQHRVQMMREVDDPDVKRQRGNAASVAHCEGVVLGIAACLRSFGYSVYADRIEHAADHGVDSVMRDDPAGDRDTLQERANAIAEADRAEDANLGRE